MQNLVILIGTILISSITSNSLFAQVDTARVSKIKIFINYVDSLSENDEKQNSVIKSISEGKISMEIVSTSQTGHGNKTDTIRNIKNGGFSKYTIHNLNGDTVYKILYHDNIDKNFYECYYYENNKLVYSKINYQEDGIGQTFYYREEYYNVNQVLFTSGSFKTISPLYRERVSFDLIKKGNDYLNKFQAEKIK